MKLYSSNDNYKLYQGNMLDMLEVIEPNTIDSVVCDPPYELNFMGKGWDNSGIAFQVDTWKKCYEVLKPGGYLLAFGGSRTFHRIACAIEDAGFEIRDTIMWLYGSGFPKSMDISKQIDKKGGNDYSKQFAIDLKQARESRNLTMKYCDDKYCDSSTNWSWYEGRKDGCRVPDYQTYLKIIKEFPELEKYRELIKEAEREVIGKKESGCFNNQEKDRYTIGSSKSLEVDITIPSTDLAKQWQGWGTALKPSYESIIVAQKPYSIEIYLLIGISDILNEVIEKCQLKLNANIVEKISKLNQAKQSVEENIVLNNAESEMFTKEDLLEVMDMLQSTLTENTNLNTELLCLNFLVEICNQMNKYTTETKINLITELKILKLLVVENILKNTTQENKMKQLGMKQNVLTVEEFLKEEKLKLNYMNILSVQDNAILKEEKNDLHPSLNQIIVARKPFKGSLVDNVIEYGVGGINIDECRVGTTGATKRSCQAEYPKKENGTEDRSGHWARTGHEIIEVNAGRFPANTILTYDETPSDERLRYFYCAKASKKDRDEGLDEFEDGNITDGRKAISDRPYLRKETPRKNIHPTVKPTELMQYLVRLVSPNGATILDPFNGSGSTGKAVMYENRERNKNYKYIGIELTEEYLPIAKARIEYVCNLTQEELKEQQMTIFDILESKGE